MQMNLNSGIDFDELDTLVADDVVMIPRRATPRIASRPRAAAFEADSAPAATVLWRLFKNTMPQLAGDLLSLTASGLLAEAVLRIAHQQGLHWQIAALAALPLVIAYWLGGLYSGIGVHPVIELREVFQLNTVALGSAAIGTILAPPLPLWCLAAWVVSIALVPLTRSFVRRWCAGRSWWGYPLLIISSGQKAQSVADVLLRAPRRGYGRCS